MKTKRFKTKSLAVTKATPSELHAITDCPNFSATGSITGMKRRYYGEGARLIRCGAWIYHCNTRAAQCLYDSLP